jgi:hypothetical protein
MKQLLLLFFWFSIYGQQVHHQMLSSQGNSSLLPSSALVNQTIGQQSAIGNYSISKLFIGQGFQQSVISKKSFVPIANTTVTKTYPNPFTDKIHFQFSKPVTGLITISIFDVLGRLVYHDQKEAIQDILTLDKLNFPQNEYLVKLTAPNYNYSTQIIQNK